MGKMETWLRINTQKLDGNGISCVPAKQCRLRFLRYLENVMLSEQQYRKKVKLKKHKFAKEEVLIYPSSQRVNDNLDEIKRKRSKIYSQSMSFVSPQLRSRTTSLSLDQIMYQADAFSAPPPMFKNLSAVIE